MLKINRINFLNAYGYTFNLCFFINQLELVTFLKALEIYLPSKNVDELICELVRDTEVFDGLRKVGLDFAHDIFLQDDNITLANINPEGIVKIENDIIYWVRLVNQ